MANIAQFISRRCTLGMIVFIAIIFLLDMSTRYKTSELVTYKMKLQQPLLKNDTESSQLSSKTDHIITKISKQTINVIKQHVNVVKNNINEKKKILMLHINSLKQKKASLQQMSKGSGTAYTKQSSLLSAEGTNLVKSTVPGLESMDRDLSLPPEIPVRPDSKEPILQYSQRRDYEAIISHDDKCGQGGPADMDLQSFDYNKNIYLLLVIKSACSLKSRRSAIRSTWGNEVWAKNNLGVNIRRVFLLGKCEDDSLKKAVVAEDKLHGDLLQWNFFDSFRNLTLKDCLFLQWFTRNCRNVPFVFKGDDDVFVNVHNVVQYLKELSTDRREQLFVGSVLKGSPRILNPQWKYYVSYNLYPEKFYPPYVSGGGFLMSSPLVTRLFQASLLRRIIPIDDAFLGILLKKIGVQPQNDRGFKSWGMKKVDICRISKIKTFHKMLPEQLLKTWHDLLELDTSKCHDESNDIYQSPTKR